MKTQTNITVGMIYVTPETAANYLKYNIKNRKISENNLKFLINEMKTNNFIENGESIIFDKYGHLKDGQYRLTAIVKSGKSYWMPVVRGVEPESMATYDTGKPRNAGDVLTLNGFHWGNRMAALIMGISKYAINKSKKSGWHASLNKNEKLSNHMVLEYCQMNYEWLKDIVAKTDTINANSKPILLSGTQLGILAYIIGGETPSQEVYDFLKHIVGVYRTPSTATNYLYSKLYNSKVNKEPLNFYWILGASIKCYNYYIDGNPSIRNIVFMIDQELPKINKR